MAKITQYYGISGAVEFLDIELSTDNRLFVDPRSIRLQRSAFAAEANKCTKTFFDEITRCVVSPNSSDQNRGLDLLQQFTEPRETRLGLSRHGIDGHGAGEIIGRAIWDALFTNLNAFVRVGILKFVEDLPVFVENVAEDRTSDLTTRIAFAPLAQFTQAMVAKYPEFTAGSHKLGAYRRQVWDTNKTQWGEADLVLPIASDKPLLLVPRDWARTGLLMSSGRYFETTLLTFAQEQRTVLGSDGKPLKPPKSSLKKQAQFARGVDTNIRVTDEANRISQDLMERFRSFVDTRYAPLSDEAINRRIGA